MITIKIRLQDYENVSKEAGVFLAILISLVYCVLYNDNAADFTNKTL